ncbi:hypothetical protein HQ590_10220 [bacterium]|nr:hypothetical protein [bacterium]
MQIENESYLVAIEPEHGALVRVRDKVGQLELITEPRLAESFRLLLPLADGASAPQVPGVGTHANYILGTAQKLSRGEVNGPSITLAWSGPLRSEHGRFDLDVTIRIALADQEVRFDCEVVNRTKHQLAEVWYGLIGGMTGLSPRGDVCEAKATKCLLPTSATQWAAEPFREFGVGSPPNPGLGLLGPEYTWWYPGHMPMPWVSFYQEALDRGVYFACHDPEARSKVFRLAMSPGTADARVDGDWPRPEELNGLPAGVTMNWTFFPYTKPGQTFTGPTLVVRAHPGGWPESAALYRAWFDRTFGVVDSRQDWLRRETSFLDTMFLLPEDNINLTFRDIPAWAKTAADHGITSVMISGWHVGGHDRGYPQYEPDPRLGTWEELGAGIRACHDLGLRVSFFANVQTVDITTSWYKKELHQYEIKDPWGGPYHVIGWGMGTVGARKGLTRTPLYELNPAHPEVRALLIGQFRKLATIGADGVHLDKNFIHPLDFNPRLTLGPDRALTEGMLLFYRELLDACRAVRPGFCVSYENHWDRLMSFSEVEWWAIGPSPLKIAFPEWVSTNGITQPYDYNRVNQLVLGGQNIMVGPANYMRGLDYPPMQELCRYIGEVTRIRRELHQYVSRGRWLDSHVKLFACRNPVLKMSGPFAGSPHAGWTVFADPQTGKRAVVLANLDGQPIEVGGLSLTDNAGGACRVYQPFAPVHEARFPVALTLPPERVAFVVEA